MRNTKKLVTLALLTTVALMLSYVEAMLPSFGVPGVKMGLANIAVIFVLYRFGPREAALISLFRVVLNGFLFTGLSALLYSFCGAVLSLLGMILLKKSDRFSAVGVSVAGGVLHNAGQILVAMLVMETTAFTYYFPVLALSGTISGILIGLCGAELVKKVPENFR